MYTILTATEATKTAGSADDIRSAAKLAETLKFADTAGVANVERLGKHLDGKAGAAKEVVKQGDILKFRKPRGPLPPFKPLPYVKIKPIPKPTLYAKTKAFFVKLWWKVIEALRKSYLGKFGRKGLVNKEVEKTSFIPKTFEAKKVYSGDEHKIPELNLLNPEASDVKNILDVDLVQPTANAPKNLMAEKPANIKTKLTFPMESQPDSTLSGKTESIGSGEPKDTLKKYGTKSETPDVVSKSLQQPNEPEKVLKKEGPKPENSDI
ncbi:hypothetical protein BY996DRAFT_6410725 [Phakopsora pachyrhizi]|uniref:Uncharacterized protein n=1 Tax=Phakopsora pachyrhizi TaxID=170000 RepID=A0AAV0BLB0_PHAPC|nr:hypothetical protein BY996DRAFT_6410725 [Phakopsora pachyrhizi]CAH7688025.1 hypothetical protein PPACK8108_LOCUS22917 [Phakopsora pachyrhizi]